METHAVQNLLPLRLRRKQLRSLHVASEDRIRKRGRRLIGSMNDDLDVTRPNLLNNLPDAREVRVEQERLSHRLIVDRGVCEPNLEGPQIAFTNRQTAADCAEPLRDRLHVIAEGQMVLEERLQASLQRLVVDLQEAVHERSDIELAGVRDELVQDAVRVRPPESDEVFAGEQLLDQVAQGDVHDLAVPARDHRVRVGDRRHIDHAVLPDLLDLPRTSADDEVEALAGLDHHELLAEDADLPLRREVHDRVTALVADRREVLEVVATTLWRDADPVSFLADDAEGGEELCDSVGLGVFELAVRFRGANRR